MIDEKKVSLMTKLTIYEKNENRGTLAMSKFYKNDFVRFNVLKTLVAASITYWGIVGAYMFLHFNIILTNMNDMDYFDAVYKLLTRYVLVCFIYYVFSSVLYRRRYEAAVPELTEYNSALKDLIEAQGGPVHRVRAVKNSSISTPERRKRPVNRESAALRQQTVARQASRPDNPGMVRVNREARVRQVNNLNEPGTAQRVRRTDSMSEPGTAQRVRRTDSMSEPGTAQRVRQDDMQRIQDRRKQLEQAQMEKMRAESLRRISRENHTYGANNEGSDS